MSLSQGIGIALGVTITVSNLVILAFIVYRYGRGLRRKQDTKKGATGSNNMAFRAEAGTAKSFNSLASKFNSGVTDVETISTSSVNTVS